MSHELTPRERDVLRLVAQARPDKEIANLLFISPVTVRNHLQSARDKTGLRNRTELALFVVRGGLEPGRQVRA